MIQRFANDLSKVDIFGNGNDLPHILGFDQDENGQRIYTAPESREQYVATLANPVLVTDLAKIAELNPPMRDTLAQLYKSAVVNTEYDGTSLRFEQGKYPGLWGPNIDTLAFCEVLASLPLSGHGTEVGGGSGFISKYALAQHQGIDSLDLIDMNPGAYHCWQDNITDKRAQFLIGDATRILKGREYDFMLCNPPYIPRKSAVEDNAYEGLGLFAHLIENMERLLPNNGPFIANYSSLCGEEFEEIVERSNRKVELHGKRHVPLKVFNIYNNETWLTDLIENHGLVVEKERDDHWYWHDINVVKITQR